MMLVRLSELDGHAWLWIMDVVYKVEVVESLKFKYRPFAKQHGVTTCIF